MSYKEYAKNVVQELGGKENIKDIYHCATRLRVKVKHPNSINKENIKQLSDTVTVIESGGQIQIVVGQHVADVYKQIIPLLDIEAKKPVDENLDEEIKDKNFMSGFLDIISGVFTPILSLLTATGVIKGLLALLTTTNILSPESGVYQLLNIAGDSFFYFLPVFLGYTSMKKFGGTPFLGMALGAALIHPNVSTILANPESMLLLEGSIFETSYSYSFFGLPILFMNYGSSVIPIILTTYFAAKLESFLDSRIHRLVKSFVVPMLVLMIMVSLSFMIIGPISTFLSNILGEVALNIYNVSPTLLGFLYGLLIQVCVMFGLHWGFITISINSIATLGFDPVTITGLTAGFAQAGAALVVMRTLKAEKYKRVGIPSLISSLFGITEPVIYGINLPLKVPFIVGSIASGIGGAIMGYFGARQYNFGANGIFGFLNVINPETGWDISVTATIIACIVSFLSAALMMYLVRNKLKNPQLEK